MTTRVPVPQDSTAEAAGRPGWLGGSLPFILVIAIMVAIAAMLWWRHGMAVFTETVMGLVALCF